MALPRKIGSSSRCTGSGAASWGNPVGRGTLPGAALLIVVGFLIYAPVLRGTWLWDDRTYIADNAIVHSPDGYWKAWVNLNPLGSHTPGDFNPLTTLMEWVEWHLWGDGTVGYHLVNVVLQLASALLVWRLYHRLGLSFAWLGALIFLTHPLMVETVAWISELKNTLSLPPLLLAMLAWLDHDETDSPAAYRRAFLWFSLSLAAKAAGLMLPVMLLVYAWSKRGTVTGKDLKTTLPFFAVSLLAAVFTLKPAHLAGAHELVVPVWSVGGGLASVGWTILFLVGKALFPVRLFPEYPGLSIMQPAWWDLVPWVLFAVMAVLFFAAWRRAVWVRPLAFGLGFFLLNLLPVLLFVFKSYPSMAWSLDHLVYLPIVGLIGGAVALAGEVDVRLGGRLRRWEQAGLAFSALCFACGSHMYAAEAFTSEDSFWAYMLQREPGNWQIHRSYGELQFDRGHVPEAIGQFQAALALNADFDGTWYDLGLAQIHARKLAEAKASLLEAARLNPKEMRAYLSLAELASSGGDLPAAEAYIDQAQSVAPDSATPLAAKAALLLQMGRRQDALDQYAKAVAMSPDVVELHYNYGVALLQAKDFSGAARQFQAALDLNGELATAHQNLGMALAQMGALPHATEEFEAAIRLDPNYVVAHDNLAFALLQAGRPGEAIAQFQRALEIDPRDARARSSLAQLRKALAPALR